MSKQLIQEAVLCYEAGAIRASIVSTWTTVFFDILDKARELSIAGDVPSQKLMEKFEKAEKNGDVSALLKFEREILDIAQRDLELISDSEKLDLSRIQQDRHRCAHPTFDSSGNRFVPPAELCRAHIANASKILLAQPPVQGKTAINSIMETVSSRLFPADQEKVLVALAQTGLARPRDSLLRNVIVLFLKNSMGIIKAERSANFMRALSAVIIMHRKTSLGVFRGELSKLIRAIPDTSLNQVLFLIGSEKELCQFVETDQINRIILHIQSMSNGDLMYIDDAISIDVFKEAAVTRIQRLTIGEIEESLFFFLPRELGDKLIDLLSSSGSFDTSNAVCVEMRKHLRDFSPEQKKQILMVGEENDQVEHAFDYKNLILEIESQLAPDEEVVEK